VYGNGASVDCDDCRTLTSIGRRLAGKVANAGSGHSQAAERVQNGDVASNVSTVVASSVETSLLRLKWPTELAIEWAASVALAQHLAHFAGQHLQGKRFLQEGAGVERAFMQDGIFGVAGKIEHLGLRIRGAQLGG